MEVDYIGQRQSRCFYFFLFFIAIQVRNGDRLWPRQEGSNGDDEKILYYGYVLKTKEFDHILNLHETKIRVEGWLQYFFFMWTVSKVFIEFVTILLLFYVFSFFFGHEVFVILARQAGIRLALPALKGRDLTTGLPGKSHSSVF